MRLDKKDISEDVSLNEQTDDGCQADLGLVVESHAFCKSLLIDKLFRSWWFKSQDTLLPG